MNLKTTLQAGRFRARLDGQSKPAIIEELVDLLMECDGVSDRQAVLDCILEREAKMSTGMQQGIAIPHGKTGAAKELLVAVGLKPEGVDFGALDGEPSRIFLITVSPESDSGQHIKFLGAVSKQLSRESVRDGVLKAMTQDQLLSAMLPDDGDA